MKCQQPGCTGTIEDGYCNVCGMAPAPAHAPATGTGTGTGTGPSVPTGTGTTGTGRTGTSRRATSGRSRASSRGHLGAGLVEIPPIPARDPASVIMASPAVSEDKRYCGRCGEPVGRTRDGKPGRTDGFCANCGQPFSFVPKLVTGDLVGRQYEIVGCLAYGGLGWIYLARDRNVEDRWVVLKGLLDSGDADAMAAAVAERRFLAEVEHPNIVRIYNFVEHAGAGYIVMEYVGGTSLKDLLRQRRDANNGKPDPLPVTQAIAYILEVLPAMGYLHKKGLLYCDFKPDNVMQTDDMIKLIDLGGVRLIDDQASAVYGTVGFQAPEIADAGPSITSDLFTIARALAVMTLDFRGYQKQYQYALPEPADVPLFAAHDSLYRWLLKGTATNPDDRFQSAEEMAEQLLGVLREVVAASDGTPRPAASTLFTGDFRGGVEKPEWRTLPLVRVALDDPAAGFLATVGVASSPTEVVDLLRSAPVHSVEVDLQLARALIEAGSLASAGEVLDAISAADQWDWRVDWYRGLMVLSSGNDARPSFEAVYRNLPGELAPKLALGVACEAAGDQAAGGRWYDVVSETDPAFTTASFGLGRCRLAAGDRAGAVEALNRVPETSSSYLEAQISAARALVTVNGSSFPGVADLTSAGTTVAHLQLEGAERASLTRDLLAAALQLLQQGHIRPDPGVSLLGSSLTEQRLRLGLERAYRTLARLTPARDERIRLVDLANQVRPRTLV